MKQGEKVATTLTTLANATELAASVIERVAGDEIATRIDGKPVRLVDLTDAIATKLQSHLVARVDI